MLLLSPLLYGHQIRPTKSPCRYRGKLDRVVRIIGLNKPCEPIWQRKHCVPTLNAMNTWLSMPLASSTAIGAGPEIT